MNATEWKFFHGIVEHASREAYVLGYSDGLCNKPERKQAFTLSKEAKLSLEAILARYVKKH